MTNKVNCHDPTENNDKINRTRPKILALITVASGGLMLGTVLAWSSPAVPNLQKSEDMGILSDESKSWIGSIVTVGALVGAPAAGYCIEKYGRKLSLLATTLPFILGWLLIAFSHKVILLCIGRFLTVVVGCGSPYYSSRADIVELLNVDVALRIMHNTRSTLVFIRLLIVSIFNGFGVGALSLAAPVYISEISDDKIRGTLGAAFQLMVSIGMLFTFVIGSLVSWNTMAIICSTFPVIFLIAMSFMMESPRYYISKGMYPEANKALSWFRAADYKNPTKEILTELDNVQNSIDRAREEAATYKDLLKISILKPVLVILSLMFFNQFCGINAVAFHATEIFEKSDTGIDSNLSTIIMGVVQVLVTVVASILVDRVGRRILLLLSFLTMSFSLAFLGIFFLLQNNDSVDNAIICWLPLTSVVTFNIGYSIGLGPLVWTVMSELLPSNIVGLASAIATTFNWALAFVVTRFFRDVLSSLGIEWCFWLFSISCALGALFVFFLIPETKGKSLDEIQEHFISKRKPLSHKPTSESKAELVV